MKNGKSEAVKVNDGSQVAPAPNCATKLETDADVMVAPSEHTSTMLFAGGTGEVSLPVDGGVTTGGGDDAVEESAGTVTGVALLLQVKV